MFRNLGEWAVLNFQHDLLEVWWAVGGPASRVITFLLCTGYLRKLYICPAANVILTTLGNTVSKQNWGLAAHCQTQAEDKGW